MAMTRIHVVGTPRSGTTLMLELLVNGFEVDGHSPKEQSVLDVRNPLPRGVYCSKHVRDTALAWLLLRCDPNLWIVFMLRDPRDVIVSRHGKSPELYRTDLRRWRRGRVAAGRAATHARCIIVRYEDLARRPDEVQRMLALRIPLLRVKAPFSEYHLAARPSRQSLIAMHGVRPVSAASIGAWRDHKPRIVAQTLLHGSLSRDLIELGYEPDESWLQSLKGIEADFRFGFRKNRASLRRRLGRKAALLHYVAVCGWGCLKAGWLRWPRLSSAPARDDSRTGE